MPLYEYQCQQCQRRVEKIQKFSDAPLVTCPHCGGTLERTITAPAIQFKGSGWYKDLYSSAKPAAAAGASGETAPAAGGSAAAGGDAKSGDGKGGDGRASSAPAAAASASPAPAASSSGAGSGSTGS